jgi:hypothetical protein
MLRRSILFFVIAIIAAVAGFDAFRSTDSSKKHDHTKPQAKVEIDR